MCSRCSGRRDEKRAGMRAGAGDGDATLEPSLEVGELGLCAPNLKGALGCEGTCEGPARCAGGGVTNMRVIGQEAWGAGDAMAHASLRCDALARMLEATPG